MHPPYFLLQLTFCGILILSSVSNADFGDDAVKQEPKRRTFTKILVKPEWSSDDRKISSSIPGLDVIVEGMGDNMDPESEVGDDGGGGMQGGTQLKPCVPEGKKTKKESTYPGKFGWDLIKLPLIWGEKPTLPKKTEEEDEPCMDMNANTDMEEELDAKSNFGEDDDCDDEPDTPPAPPPPWFNSKPSTETFPKVFGWNLGNLAKARTSSVIEDLLGGTRGSIDPGFDILGGLRKRKCRRKQNKGPFGKYPDWYNVELLRVGRNKKTATRGVIPIGEPGNAPGGIFLSGRAEPTMETYASSSSTQEGPGEPPPQNGGEGGGGGGFGSGYGQNYGKGWGGGWGAGWGDDWGVSWGSNWGDFVQPPSGQLSARSLSTIGNRLLRMPKWRDIWGYNPKTQDDNKEIDDFRPYPGKEAVVEKKKDTIEESAKEE